MGMISGCSESPSPPNDVAAVIEEPDPVQLPENSDDLAVASEQGRIHFDSYACWRCHALGTEELPGLPDFDNMGPDLASVGDRLDPTALYQSLTNPNLAIAEPRADHVNEQGISKMPPFDSVIPEKELIELVAFLSQQQSLTAISKPVIVTEENFATEVSAATQLVLLDFWAEWCLPCLEIEPLLETIAADLGEQIKICKINVDDNPNLVADHVPDNMFPCLILMTNNTLIERVYGTDPKMEPKAFLDQWIAKHLPK